MINLSLHPPKPSSNRIVLTAFLALFAAVGYTILLHMYRRGLLVSYNWLLILRGSCLLLAVAAMLQELWPYLRAEKFINTFKVMEPKVNKWFKESLMHHNLTKFALFIAVSYMVPMFMHSIGKPDAYNWLLAFRIVGALLCVGLLLKSQWPDSLERYLTPFYHFTLMFCLPFMTTFLFLLEGESTEWIVNVILVITLLLTLVDGTKFIMLSTFGIALAMGLYRLGIGPLNLSMSIQTIDLLLYAIPLPVFGILGHRATVYAKYAYSPQLSVHIDLKQYYLEEHPEVFITLLERNTSTRAVAYLLSERKQEEGKELLDTLIGLNPARKEVILRTAQELLDRNRRTIELEADYRRTISEMQVEAFAEFPVRNGV